MNKKIKAISAVSVAMTLFGVTAPMLETTPTVWAAKKSSKKSTKKSKKSTKKTSKKVVKKSTKKKIKKVVKKSTKKATKKTVKRTTMAAKYQPTVRDMTVKYNSVYNRHRVFVTNPAGYFPKDPALVSEDDEPGLDCTQFELMTEKPNENIFIEPGTHTVYVKVTYPDGSTENTKKFKITVLPSQAETIKVSLKSGFFIVPANTVLNTVTEGYWKEDTEWGYRLLDPGLFLNNASALPKGTVVKFDGVKTSGKLKPGDYYGDFAVDFPDGSSYRVDTIQYPDGSTEKVSDQEVISLLVK